MDVVVYPTDIPGLVDVVDADGVVRRDLTQGQFAQLADQYDWEPRLADRFPSGE